jgi:hypothetical protein
VTLPASDAVSLLTAIIPATTTTTTAVLHPLSAESTFDALEMSWGDEVSLYTPFPLFLSTTLSSYYFFFEFFCHTFFPGSFAEKRDTTPRCSLMAKPEASLVYTWVRQSLTFPRRARKQKRRDHAGR